MKKTIVLVAAVLALSGCTEMQQSAMMGTLIGTAGGALMGKSKDRGRNALIGAGVGLLGGSLYGKHKQSQSLQEENAVLRRTLENYDFNSHVYKTRR